MKESSNLPLDDSILLPVTRTNGQLLKWIGNKQRFAPAIISCFPPRFGRYFEPFLGSGAILGTLAPRKAFASDSFAPLMEIWQTLKAAPELLKKWYRDRWSLLAHAPKIEVYELIKASYNKRPNGADLLYLSRACYGGVVRFRQSDGYMSTPCGVHEPISPESFDSRADDWHIRTSRADFVCADFKEALAKTDRGDLVYCDPPYSHTQRILYGAQQFDLNELFDLIGDCKRRGVYVILSIDGTKKSGNLLCNIPFPKDVFKRELQVNCGRSMLKRFQRSGQSLEDEVVADRLLLTF